MYLAQLYAQDGLIQDEMSNKISVDRAATTRTLQAMEKKGLVRREQDENNHRAKRVYLTEKARELEPRIRELQTRWVDFITQDLTQEESDTFARQLRMLAQRAREINS